MHSKLWKITKMLLAVLVLLTVNIGCAPVQGEDKMTHVEWSTFYMSRNHQFRTLCYSRSREGAWIEMTPAPMLLAM